VCAERQALRHDARVLRPRAAGFGPTTFGSGGDIPFDPQAANLMFMLVSRRYERASLIVTSHKPFGLG